MLSSPEPAATFECRLDGAAFAACVTPTGFQGLSLGPHTFAVRAVDAAGNADATPATFDWEIVAGIVMAAGDIACAPGSSVTPTACRHQQTSDLLANEPELTNVLALGDMQYEDSCYADFFEPGAYDATWGRKKAITKPLPGNHEYHDPTPCPPIADGYFTYFGSAAGDYGKGYYSFDIGPWHVIALNSNVSAAPTSTQGVWLAGDLATTTKTCTLAMWHRPRYSSGSSHGDSPPTSAATALWNAVYDAGADLVLTAHEHSYERFAPQDKSGQRDDARGIREFVVGSGGASHGGFIPVAPATSEVRDETTFGVLKLILRASSYEWEFVPEAGGTFTDSGSGTCH